MTILKNWSKSENYPVMTMLFSEKWLKNDPQFLLQFPIHIDVLMPCESLADFGLNFLSYDHFLKLAKI